MEALYKKKMMALWMVLLLFVCHALVASPFAAQAAYISHSITVKVNLDPNDTTSTYTAYLMHYNGESWDAPIYPVNGTADGTKVFSNLDSGQYELHVDTTKVKDSPYEYYYYYKNLSVTDRDLAYTAELISIQNPNYANFYDNNYIAGIIAGTLQWGSPSMEDDSFSFYQVYFADDSGNIITNVPPLAVKSKLETTTINGAMGYRYEVPDTAIPAGAEQLRFYKTSSMDSADKKKTPVYITLRDSPGDFMFNVQQQDSNKEPGYIQGTITWNKIGNESRISHYAIYERYSNAFRQIGIVLASGEPWYSFELPYEYQVGVSAPDLYITTLDWHGEISNYYSIQVTDDTSSRTNFPLITNSAITAPTKVDFYDFNPDPNKISGYLNWNYNSNVFDNAFAIYFMDGDNHVLQSYKNTYFHYKADSYGIQIPDNTELPAGTKYIGVSAMTEGGVSVPGMVSLLYRNAKLSALSTDAAAITPAFSSSTYLYSSTVSSNVYSTAVTATAESPGATVTIMGVSGLSTVTTHVNLVPGVNNIPVWVTAEDGIASGMYNLSITRVTDPLSGNTQLNSLSLGGDYSLSPSFAKDITSYTTTVDSKATSITVNAAVYDTLSRISITYPGMSAAATTAAGSVTESVYLNSPSTDVNVTVLAQNGAQSTYKINVLRPVLLTMKGSIGAVYGNKIIGVANGTTVGTLLSQLSLQSGATAKVVNKTTGNAVNDFTILDPSLKLVLNYGTNATVEYEIQLLRDLLQELTGMKAGDKFQIHQLIQFLSFKRDITGDGVFNAEDVRKAMLEISPIL
ncbi:cadherin-like beta sandwich domain-containing protein [Paenibacillus radicis (ex Xue et al. 2023)]|uniref:Cadherin-like beta sandwich domain-containing protein n=1 Tax=Paenibacillus radicis (ex Xue et al. 2023) TaxID=2972489 RepID=A0ABT1YI33_9BACL|nr:cadherin-like beta sandwich domain-containing protein [Paenibacillus radicis (ex Xue et al. 2023)]MCR8632637.1 cadherin-like beta sandwich domain-containing protein [Paenibacillus radicis (ex Xue et al. 2023)]